MDVLLQQIQELASELDRIKLPPAGPITEEKVTPPEPPAKLLEAIGVEAAPVPRLVKKTTALVPISEIKNLLPAVSDRWAKAHLVGVFGLADIQEMVRMSKEYGTDVYSIVDWNQRAGLPLEVIGFLLDLRKNYPWLSIIKARTILEEYCDGDQELLGEFLEVIEQRMGGYAANHWVKNWQTLPNFILNCALRDIKESHFGSIQRWLTEFDPWSNECEWQDYEEGDE